MCKLTFSIFNPSFRLLKLWAEGLIVIDWKVNKELPEVKHVCWINIMCNEQRYSLKSTMECVLWLELLQKIDFAIFHEHRLLLCSFTIFEIGWNHSWIHCLQKLVRLSSVLLLLPFYEGFSNLVKNEEFREGYKSNFCEQ